MEVEVMINEKLKECIDNFLKENSTEIQNAKIVPIDNLKINSDFNETGYSLFTIRTRQD